jgi:polysaccharide deacetylase 2 family uncharacterized protein YibQ
LAADDLSAPLGQNLPRKKRKRVAFALPIAPSTLVIAALGLVLAVFVGWAMVVTDPMGGEPSVVVALSPGAVPPAKSETKPDTAAAPAAPAGQSPAQNQSIITIIDGSTGKREEVPIAGEARNTATAGDPRLLETSRHGPIPKVAADGTRPADVYARPAGTTASSNAPRIAIVVVGLGVGAKFTADAIARLPGPVTLAFSPYGSDIARSVTRARETGHEVLLQVPMEPLDYPDNDPGPPTLLTSLTVEQNTDRLHWLMSRFPGYVGVANFMGSRFTATEAALAPMIKETAKRGLIYFDDGSATRSLAGQIAGANNAPFAKADVVLDAVPTQAEMAKAFSKLEAAARSGGTAIGLIGALPVSLDRVVQWVKTAEGRGFVLVPISVAAQRNKSS